MQVEPRMLGRVTISFDLVQTSGTFWHDLDEVVNALVDRDIRNLDVVLYGKEGSGKLIAGEISGYDVQNLTVDNIEKAGT